jgi:hypothetical protein
MKKLAYLLNTELSGLFKPVCLIVLFNVAAQLLLAWLANQSGIRYNRFESFYGEAGCITIFCMSLLVLLGLLIFHFYSHWWGSKSIYTLMTLPMKRSTVYVSMLSGFYLVLLFFLATNLIAAVLCYGLFHSQISNVIYPGYVIENGLFLAFVRSDFLRMLVPLTPEGLFSTLSLLALLPAAVLYGAISERSMRYLNLIPVGMAFVLMGLTVTRRLNHQGGLLVLTLGMVVLMSFFVWHSLYIIGKNAITG